MTTILMTIALMLMQYHECPDSFDLPNMQKLRSNDHIEAKAAQIEKMKQQPAH